jgi:transposase
VMMAATLEPERLVFVDECGTHTSMAPVYSYAPRGERLRLRGPRRRGKNSTLLSSMTLEGMGPSLTVEGSTTDRVFEAYVKGVLAPSLEPGRIVVMDNLGAHRPKRIRELIEARGCELLYLPSYSPDYDPIEEAFAKIKDQLRKAAARSKEALIEAIGTALYAISPQDARGFFEHAGYRTAGQLLWNALSELPVGESSRVINPWSEEPDVLYRDERWGKGCRHPSGRRMTWLLRCSMYL